MDRNQLQELHYMTPISNVPSIMKDGLLSHNRAKNIVHVSRAMAEIQKARVKKVVPGGKPLHDYVNLYFCARNPMLYKLQAYHGELCVLQIDTKVLNLHDVVITDGNAASQYTRFWPSPQGLAVLDYSAVFAQWWTDPNPTVAWEKKRKKCAEVLVPETVPPDYILGACVSCGQARQRLLDEGFSLPITINAYLFFQQP